MALMAAHALMFAAELVRYGPNGSPGRVRGRAWRGRPGRHGLRGGSPRGPSS
ncbi:hypothetical protein [Streptomyces purpurascens]|uniref:hypothetical protein n=1 Tax=Streptomyces purpurascens TaxID=1924 RepID=UPI003557DD67